MYIILKGKVYGESDMGTFGSSQKVLSLRKKKFGEHIPHFPGYNVHFCPIFWGKNKDVHYFSTRVLHAQH